MVPAYCVLYNGVRSGTLQEDLLADFLYMQSLQRRFPGKLINFTDICLEQTPDSLRAIHIHDSLNPLGKQDVEVDDCLVNRVEDLISKQVLIPVLIKLFNLMLALKDAYYYEYEINSHNLLVVTSEGCQELDICLIN